MNRFLRILLFIWELPQTLLASMIIVFLRKKIIKRETFKHTNILYAKNFPGGLSLGRFIIFNARYFNDKLSKKHEYGHSIQSLCLGWLYLIIVGLPSIMRVIVWRLLKLDSLNYYKGYPENWANKLGFSREEYVKFSKRSV